MESLAKKYLSQRHSGTEDDMNENDIGTIIVNTSHYLHKKLGPGLLESVYETICKRQNNHFYP
jgi:hypothetical protein